MVHSNKNTNIWRFEWNISLVKFAVPKHLCDNGTILHIVELTSKLWWFNVIKHFSFSRDSLYLQNASNSRLSSNDKNSNLWNIDRRLTSSIGVHLSSHANMVIPSLRVEPYEPSVNHWKYVSNWCFFIWITCENLYKKELVIMRNHGQSYEISKKMQ